MELVEDHDQAKVASKPFGAGQKFSNEPTEPQIQSYNSPTRAPLPTPIVFDKLEPYLTGSGYDQEELKYLKEGFRSGFRLGFQPKQFNTGAIVRNPPMDADLEKIMMTKISQEVEAGRVAGPFSSPPLENFRCSPVRLEPKKKPGEYRFIHNLSHPYGSPLSINAGIPQDNKSVNYATLDDAVTAVLATWPNTFLAKTDIKSAFKIIPVHPGDYRLLGFHWKGLYYYAKTLPMGAGSSCAVFERFSTALQHIAEQVCKVHRCIHVLDDFLFISTGYNACRQDMSSFISLCESAGVPIAHDKTAGPAQVLEFLGITIDVPGQCARLPNDKVERCRALLEGANTSRHVTLVHLQQLVGHLNFACRAVVPGRPFLAAMYSVMKKISKPHHKARLSALAKQDLVIWSSFLTSFNGRAFFQEVSKDYQLHLHTDTSTLHGYGACFRKEWFFGGWSANWRTRDIMVLEAYPILAAIATWGEQLRNKSIIFHIDNQALVHIINKGHSACEDMIPIIRILFLLGLKYNVSFSAEHIPSIKNIAADALSRFNLQVFRTSSPQAAFLPRRVPAWIHQDTFNPWGQPATSYPLWWAMCGIQWPPVLSRLTIRCGTHTGFLVRKSCSNALSCHSVQLRWCTLWPTCAINDWRHPPSLDMCRPFPWCTRWTSYQIRPTQPYSRGRCKGYGGMPHNRTPACQSHRICWLWCGKQLPWH